MDEKLKGVFDYAITAGSTEVFDALAKDFASFEQEDKDWLLRRTIVYAPNTAFIQHVLDYGKSLDYKDENGVTLLHGAAISDHPETVRFFIKKGLDVNAKDNDGWTPLMAAARETSSVEMLKALIDAGADTAVSDDDGWTLLHLAAALNPNADITKFFLEQGFDPERRNDTGNTPLMAAARETGSVEVLKALIDAGADTAVSDDDGWTLLHLAAALNPNADITKFFLEQGFDPERRDDAGRTPLMEAALYQSNVDVIDLMVKAGADITAKTERGETLLHLAAMNGESDVVRYLLPSFKATDTDSSGASCLGNALVCGTSPETVALLVKDMKAEHIRLACWNENPEILDALITAGYDANMAGSEGVTPLMWAAHLNTSPDIIRMLRRHNAIWSAVDDMGRNALHYAAANEDPAIYDWMLEDNSLKKLAGKKDADGHEPAYYREHKDEFK